MRIERPTPVRDSRLSGASSLDDREGIIGTYLWFFDEIAAVMYRKIDTTLLSATFRATRSGLSREAEVSPGLRNSLRKVTLDECCHIHSLKDDAPAPVRSGGRPF